MHHPVIALWATRVALLVFVLELGGSLYERLVLDAAWPVNPALIQPAQGGVDRKVFWMPLHGIATVALPLALWAAWADPVARRWLLVAVATYVAMRAWTFAYFIPNVQRFERATSVDLAEARAWVRWSLLRAPLLLATTYATWRSAYYLAGRPLA
ncbi:MAG TPA: hypothetical protein VM734_04270 [Kofleriaceae bacterium]|jgi:hypothetical protein|nr:hypothetical protein [Kofleriaceae bacterium]